MAGRFLSAADVAGERMASLLLAYVALEMLLAYNRPADWSRSTVQETFSILSSSLHHSVHFRNIV